MANNDTDRVQTNSEDGSLADKKNNVGAKDVTDASESAARRRKSLREYSGAEKGIRIFNMIFAAAIFSASAAWAFYSLSRGNANMRFAPSILIALLCVVPFAAEFIFRINLSNFVLLFFYVFVLFSGFIGSALGNWGRLSFMHYDKIIHGLFGYVGGVAAMFVAVKIGDYDKMRPATVAIFVFSVSMMCGAVWEVYEFTCDRLIGVGAQGAPTENGYASVWDTMYDIIANLIGAAVFTAHFVLHRATRKNLLMGSIIKDFRG